MKRLHPLRKLNLSVVTIVIITIVSCNKENSLNFGEKEQQERVFSDFQIESIGKIHNQSLELTFKDFNWSSIDQRQEINYQFNNLQLAKDNGLIFDGKPKSLEQNLLYIKQLLNNEHDYAFFEKSLNYLLNTNRKTTVLNIQNFLTDLEKEAKVKMSSIRSYETFLIFSSVSKQSAYFWLPKENGGLGKFNKFKELEQKNLGNIYSIYERTSDWRSCATDVLVADGVSAGAGFLTLAGVGAVAGIACPYCAIAAIAAESGMSSGWEYISSDNC